MASMKWGLLVLAVLLVGCGEEAGSTPAAPDHSSSPVAAAAPAPAPAVLLDVSGTGIKSTQKFKAAGDWDLEWSYDCTATGSTGNFQVYADGDTAGSMDVLANELGNKGADVTHQHTAGTFYLSVNSGCSWHVVVKG